MKVRIFSHLVYCCSHNIYRAHSRYSVNIRVMNDWSSQQWLGWEWGCAGGEGQVPAGKLRGELRLTFRGAAGPRTQSLERCGEAEEGRSSGNGEDHQNNDQVPITICAVSPPPHTLLLSLLPFPGLRKPYGLQCSERLHRSDWA